MDKIAIISDIHANLTALQAVIQDIENRDIHNIICLGDLIYKGVSPNETIDLVRKKSSVVLKGNCDGYLTTKTASLKSYWTTKQLGEERISFLSHLPVMHEFWMSGHFIRLFHASPFSLDKMYNPMYDNKGTRYANNTIQNPEDMFENTDFLGKTKQDREPDVVGYGHVHSPFVVRIKNKMLFNAGSVGMPTEMLLTRQTNETTKFTVQASYVILEGCEREKNLKPFSIQIVRVPYAVEKEIERVSNSDVPIKEEIIENLQTAAP